MRLSFSVLHTVRSVVTWPLDAARKKRFPEILLISIGIWLFLERLFATKKNEKRSTKEGYF
jgi:hypothetical protein